VFIGDKVMIYRLVGSEKSILEDDYRRELEKRIREED
jgi:hypothetical protein